MSVAPVAVTGAGCVTPVGLSAASTCAALRAGIGRLETFEGWSDAGELPDPPFVGGRVPLEWFDGGPVEAWPGHTRWALRLPRPRLLISPGPERLGELLVPAAEEAWSTRLEAGRRGHGIGCYLGLDEGDSARPLAELVAGRLGIEFDLVNEYRAGRAGGLAALGQAANDLRAGRIRVALVGAVDSRLRRRVITDMVERGTLRTEENAAGVVPGEAAACVVLEPTGSGESVFGRVLGVGVADEPTAGTEEPSRGDGLTRAVRRARAEATALTHRPLLVSDLNGDRYRALEWGLVNPRALGDLPLAAGGPGSSQMWHPADCIGDSGAASGVLNVLWALTAMRRGYALTSRALVWGASETSLRAAVVLGAAMES